VSQFQDEFAKLSEKMSKNLEDMIQKQNDYQRRQILESSMSLSPQSKTELLNQFHMMLNENLESLIKTLKHNNPDMNNANQETQKMLMQSLAKLESTKEKELAFISSKLDGNKLNKHLNTNVFT